MFTRKSVYHKNIGDGKICSKWLSVRPKIIELIINKFLLINSPLYVVASALLGMTHTDKMRIGIVFADILGKKIYANKS